MSSRCVRAGRLSFSEGSTTSIFYFLRSLSNCCWCNALTLMLALSVAMNLSLPARATVNLVSLDHINLLPDVTNNVTAPVHFSATAESDLGITGFVVYIDNHNVYQNYSPSMDAWVVLQPGTTHSVYIKAWDSSGSLASSATYTIGVTGVAPPAPPRTASIRNDLDNPDNYSWIVDNSRPVGGQCGDGSLGQFNSASDPNIANSPDHSGVGQHFVLNSKCQYDDSLFYLESKNAEASHTNFLWDFWVYVPTTTQSSTIQALEFDFFQALQLGGLVHEFMFGSQCNYQENQWQNWLPQKGVLDLGGYGTLALSNLAGELAPFNIFFAARNKFGYQVIPAEFSSSSDNNNSLRFGNLTVDGNTMYLDGFAPSTVPTNRLGNRLAEFNTSWTVQYKVSP